MAVSASPLFLSSAGSATLADELARTGPWNAGLRVKQYGRLYGPVFPPDSVGDQGPGRTVGEVLAERTTALERATRGISHIGPLVVTVRGSLAELSAAPRRSGSTAEPPAVPVKIATRTGFASQIEPVATGSGPGVWIPDTTARDLGVEPGDRVTLATSRGPRARVAGVYRDLRTVQLPPYWGDEVDLFFAQTSEGILSPRPPLLLADLPTFLRIERALREGAGQFEWEAPLVGTRLTLPETRAVAARIQRVTDQLETDTPLAQSFQQFHSGAGIIPYYATSLPDAVRHTEVAVAAIQGPVRAVSLAGGLLALGMAVAAGLAMLERRRVEMRLLLARGMSRGALAARTGTEGLLPIAAGGAAGMAASLGLVTWLGPSSVLDREGIWTAVRFAGVGLAAAVVVLAVVVGIRADREDGQTGSRWGAASRRIPWELGLLALAAASYYELVTRAGEPTFPGAPARVDVFLLLFPILFVAGTAALAARVVPRLAPLLRRVRVRSHALFLAARRVAAARGGALVLMTATAVAVGILTYAALLASSFSATMAAKAQVLTGSDVAATLVPTARVPRVSEPATVIHRLTDAEVRPRGIQVSLLGVDRSTFEAAAFWRGGFADVPLRTLLGRLGASDAALRVVVVGGSVPAEGDVSIGGFSARYEVAGTARAFPGQRSGAPLLVADAEALPVAFGLPPGATASLPESAELWIRGPADRITRELARDGSAVQISTARDVLQTVGFRSLAWTFGFTQALGIVAGLVALAGLVLYVQARRRRQVVAMALAGRMGLSARDQRRSLIGELTGLLGAAFFVGAVVGVVAGILVSGHLDLMAETPPPPFVVIPWAVLGGALIVLAAAAWLAGRTAQRGMARENVAEVMRAVG